MAIFNSYVTNYQRGISHYIPLDEPSNHHFQWVNPLNKPPFSIANCWHNQRVLMIFHTHMQPCWCWYINLHNWVIILLGSFVGWHNQRVPSPTVKPTVPRIRYLTARIVASTTTSPDANASDDSDNTSTAESELSSSNELRPENGEKLEMGYDGIIVDYINYIYIYKIIYMIIWYYIAIKRFQEISEVKFQF